MAVDGIVDEMMLRLRRCRILCGILTSVGGIGSIIHLLLSV